MDPFFGEAHPVVFRSNVILLESYHIYTSDRSHYSCHKVLGNEITMASTKGGGASIHRSRQRRGSFVTCRSLFGKLFC